jgi:CRISPR-associated protein Cas2
MSEKGFYLVVYDITSNKRRNRTHRLLLGYGTPVQYSVFECLLSKEEKDELEKLIQKKIKPRLDHVRIYRICASCQNEIVIMGRSEVTKDEDVIVV